MAALVVKPKKLISEVWTKFCICKTDFRIATYHQEVGHSSQYVCLCLLTIPNPKSLLNHDMNKVSSLAQ